MKQERARTWMRLVSAMAGVLLAVAPATAQTIRGTVTGTVTDSTGAAVPGITVTVTNTATGIGSSAQTNRDGTYTIPLLASGSYQAVVEQSGFKKYLRSGIVVQIAQTTLLDIALQVGNCLLYTSDAADERSSVDLGGRRIIKKKSTRARSRSAAVTSLAAL